MDGYKATETAYKNGYNQGIIDTVNKIKSHCLEIGIYPAVIARIIEQVTKEVKPDGRTDNKDRVC